MILFYPESVIRPFGGYYRYVYKKLEDDMITHTGLLKTILNEICCDSNP